MSEVALIVMQNELDILYEDLKCLDSEKSRIQRRIGELRRAMINACGEHDYKRNPYDPYSDAVCVHCGKVGRGKDLLDE